LSVTAVASGRFAIAKNQSKSAMTPVRLRQKCMAGTAVRSVPRRRRATMAMAMMPTMPR
jgi:hypothetical protein